VLVVHRDPVLEFHVLERGGCDPDVLEQQFDFGLLVAVELEQVELLHLPDLGGDGAALVVSGAAVVELPDGLLRTLEFVGLELLGCDHTACAALPGFAVHAGHIAFAEPDEVVHVLHALQQQVQLGRPMVEEPLLSHLLKQFRGLLALVFHAQVLHLVVLLVSALQEVEHFGVVVAESLFEVAAGEPHGDDVVVDLSQIKVESVFNQSAFVRGH